MKTAKYPTAKQAKEKEKEKNSRICKMQTSPKNDPCKRFSKVD
jgi:hypothetical protein